VVLETAQPHMPRGHALPSLSFGAAAEYDRSGQSTHTTLIGRVSDREIDGAADIRPPLANWPAPLSDPPHNHGKPGSCSRQ
jgi:hypothetical protein